MHRHCWGAGDQKKRAARIVGNLCTLVNDPRDMQPYVPLLLPELKVRLLLCMLWFVCPQHLATQLSALRSWSPHSMPPLQAGAAAPARDFPLYTLSMPPTAAGGTGGSPAGGARHGGQGVGLTGQRCA